MVCVERTVFLAGVVCLLANSSFAEERSVEKPSSLDGSVDTYDAYLQIAETRDRIVADAIAVLRSSQGDFRRVDFRRGDFRANDPRFVAIWTVEKFRAPEAVGPLCDMIDSWSTAPTAVDEVGNVVDRNGRLVKGRAEVAPHYPAAKALVEIGSPAARECLDRLVAHGRTSRSWLYLWVIREVYGEELGRTALEVRFKAAGDNGHFHPGFEEVLADYNRLESFIEK